MKKEGSRENVIATTDCPTCGAKAGNGCVRLRGKPRITLHLSRWEQWCERNNVATNFVPWRRWR
jgi:hypothetical protein